MEGNLTPNELFDLRNSKTEQDWNKVVQRILDDRKGVFPPDWGYKVLAGLYGEVSRTWPSGVIDEFRNKSIN